MGGYLSQVDYVDTHQGYCLLNSKPSGIYLRQMEKIVGQLEAILSYHAKIMIVRFDLHQVAYTDSNQRISKFLKHYLRWLKRHYSFKRIAYTWAREQDTADAQHYHVAVMLDGDKVQSAGLVCKGARDHWLRLSGSEWTPKNPFYNISRNIDDHRFKDAVYRLSYFAKGKTKGKRPEQTKDYSCSRIKPNLLQSLLITR